MPDLEEFSRWSISLLNLSPLLILVYFLVRSRVVNATSVKSFRHLYPSNLNEIGDRIFEELITEIFLIINLFFVSNFPRQTAQRLEAKWIFESRKKMMKQETLSFIRWCIFPRNVRYFIIFTSIRFFWVFFQFLYRFNIVFLFVSFLSLNIALNFVCLFVFKPIMILILFPVIFHVPFTAVACEVTWASR